MKSSSTSVKATVLFLAYNHERFVADALQSILNQDIEPLDVICGDDASTDGTYKQIKEVLNRYSGLNRVTFVRNSENLGKSSLGINQISSLMKHVSCDRIVMAHGDDIARRDRVRRILELFDSTGASVISSNSDDIDENGKSIGLRIVGQESRFLSSEEFIPEFKRPQSMIGAALAWTKQVYEQFPFFDSTHSSQGHDTLLPFRGTLLGGTYYCAEPLFFYRKHLRSGSWRIGNFGSELEFEESWMNRRMTVGMGMLKDLRHFEANGYNLPKILPLITLLEKELLLNLENWIQKRGQLWTQGRRPYWMDQEDFENLNQWTLRHFFRRTSYKVRTLWRSFP